MAFTFAGFADLLPGGVVAIAPGFAALLDAEGVPNAGILAGLRRARR
ncbi:hypothetical protein [Elioraea sp.]